MIDEGVIKFHSDWQRGDAPPLSAVADLVEWRRPLFEAGLIGHYDDVDVGYGNLSARLEAAQEFVISGTQTGHLPDLAPEHFSHVTQYDIPGNAVTCRGAVEASSESLTHAAIYELDPAIRGVVHIHNRDLWLGLGEVLPSTRPNVGYGTPAMAQEFRRLFEETDFGERGVAIMGGHDSGLVSVGHTVREAAERILTIHKDFRA